MIFALCLLPLGCVSQKKYDTLQNQLDATTRALHGQIDDRDKRIVSLQREIEEAKREFSALSARAAELANALKTAEATGTRLQGERNDLEVQLAQTVKDRSKMKDSILEMKEALADLKARKAASEARVASFRALLDRFKALIDTGKLHVRIVDGRMVVVMASDVLFSSGSAVLSEEGLTSTAEVARVLATIPDRQYQIEGHTDDVPIHNAKFPSNWELAAARATTVAKAMVDAGLPASRVSAASYGEYRPASPNDTTEGRAANRRIEIVVVPDLTGLPGFDELKKLGLEGQG